jgi:Tfp pilus assembly protein PilV
MTLVEVVVALLVLTTGVLGLAGTTGYVLRQSQLSAVATDRSVALQSVIERIKAQNYDDVADGSWSEGPFNAEWTVNQGSISKEVTIVTTGPGMVAGEGRRPYVDGEVKDTFTYRILMP